MLAGFSHGNGPYRFPDRCRNACDMWKRSFTITVKSITVECRRSRTRKEPGKDMIWAFWHLLQMSLCSAVFSPRAKNIRLFFGALGPCIKNYCHYGWSFKWTSRISERTTQFHNNSCEETLKSCTHEVTLNSRTHATPFDHQCVRVRWCHPQPADDVLGGCLDVFWDARLAVWGLGSHLGKRPCFPAPTSHYSERRIVSQTPADLHGFRGRVSDKSKVSRPRLI